MFKYEDFNFVAGSVFGHICAFIAVLPCFHKLRIFLAAYFSLGYGDITFLRLFGVYVPNSIISGPRRPLSGY